MKRIGFALFALLLSVTAHAQFLDPLLSFVAHSADPVKTTHSSITLYGAIDDEMAHKVVKEIGLANAEASSEPITIYINSPGGEIAAGGLIVDAITASRRPIWTVDIELAASMAAIIHEYGAKRFMLPHAILMFHEASAGAEGYISHIASRSALWTKLFSVFEEYVANRSGVPVAELRAHEASEWWLTTDEATKLHLNDATRQAKDIPPPEASKTLWTKLF